MAGDSFGLACNVNRSMGLGATWASFYARKRPQQPLRKLARPSVRRAFAWAPPSPPPPNGTPTTRYALHVLSATLRKFTTFF